LITTFVYNVRMIYHHDAEGVKSIKRIGGAKTPGAHDGSQASEFDYSIER